MTLETRLRDHLAAKAETIAADPPPLPVAARPARPRWRLVAAVAAAAIVALAIGAAAWLFRSAETVDPVAPDLKQLTPTLQGSLLEWTWAGGIEPGNVVGVLGVDGDVVLFATADFTDPGAPPLQMWRSPAGATLLPVEVDVSTLGPPAIVQRVVWDGERFHAFGGRFNTDPAASSAEVVEALAWTSPDGRAWDEQPLLPAGGEALPPFASRTAVVTAAAGSERGVLAVAVTGRSFDWEAYLVDRLGDAYRPATLEMINYDGAAGVYRLFDAQGGLLAEVSSDEIGFDRNARDFETEVLFAPPGGAYEPVDVLPAGLAAGELSVLATREGLYLQQLGGPAATAWFSTDGTEWEAAEATAGGDVLEIIRADSWRDLLLGAVSGRAGRTVVASVAGTGWVPISPPLVGPDGQASPADQIAAGGAGIFVHGYQFRLGSGLEEVVITKGDYRVFAYPQSGRILVNPADSTEPVLISSFGDRGPSGLPRGFEPLPGGAVQAFDPDTGAALFELTADEWASISVDAQADAPLARGWFTPDGERWGTEDLAEAFDGVGLVTAAVVTDDAVTVLFHRDPPPNVFSPMPFVPLEVWVGRPG